MNCFNTAFIPKYDNCVFNAILMASLYSTYSQKNILDKYNGWEKTNELLMTFKEILLNTDKDAITTQQFLNKISPVKLLRLLPNITETQTIWHQDFLPNFYKLLGINTLTIIYDVNDGSYIFNKDLNDDTQDTDILILYHSSYTSVSKFFTENTNSSKIITSKKTGLETIEDVITYKEKTYKLDSCLIENNQATIGLTCNGKKIVYNCLNTPEKIGDNLIEFDWSNKNNPYSFCYINNLKQEQKFSIDEEAKIFVYVRSDEAITTPQFSITDKQEIMKSMKSIKKDDILLKLLEIIEKTNNNNATTEKKLMSSRKNELIMLLIEELQKERITNY